MMGREFDLSWLEEDKEEGEEDRRNNKIFSCD